MKPTILLIGKTGQIGSELALLLPRLGNLIAFDRSQLGLTNAGDIRRAIQQIHPQIIVNAAAYTAVDQAETEESKARAINALAPAILAEEARKIGASLVHYSTDYIFDGTKNSPYSEDDPPNPLSVYGQTKLEGEQAIRSSGVPHLIFRTAWVYATQGRNFLLTMLRLATQRDELRVVRDQFGAPTRNLEIAEATSRILERLTERFEEGPQLRPVSGTYHMTAAGVATWYDFAVAIFQEAKDNSKSPPWFTTALGGLPLRAIRVSPITTKEYPTPARRPAYSVLSNRKITQTFGIALPDWQTQLHRTFEK